MPVWRVRLLAGVAVVVAVGAGSSFTPPDVGDRVSDCRTDDESAALTVLRRRCFRCHGSRRQKGDLRLDTEDGRREVAAVGDPARSELLRRVSLPKGDDDLMPPKRRLSDEDIATLRRWIGKSEAAEPAEAPAAAGESESLMRATGARIEASSGGTLRVDFSLAKQAPGAERLEPLAACAARVTELILSGQRLGDEAWAALPALPGLKRLHLERSTIRDRELARLVAGSPALEYLNLHSTGITATALDHAARLKQLRRLVLFGCDLDEDAVERFARAHPRVHVTRRLTLPKRPFETGGPRRVLAADASKQRIALLRETAPSKLDVVWERKIEQLHDLQLLGATVLFQETWTKLIEVDLASGKTVWSYDAATKNRAKAGERVEVHSFRRLPGGVTMIAESGPARIIEVDAAGTLLRRVPLRVDHPDPHHDTRLVRPTPRGTWLVAHEADGAVREYDAEGRIVWSYDVPLFGRERAGGHGPGAWGNQVFAAERLPSGNTLITTGNGHAVIEVTPAGEVVWELRSQDLPEVTLAWVTTVQVLAGGNIVVGSCHAGPDQPQLIEVTRDKKVVWTFRDFERFGNALSNAWVIEDGAAR